MPIARFQMPDGRVARFEVPEGTTPEQAQSMIEQSMASATPQEPSRSWSDVPGEALSNVLPSAANFAKGVYQSVRHPIDTGEALLKAGAGAVRNMIPEGYQSQRPEAVQASQAADAIGQFYKDRYGSVEGLKKTLATDPVGAASDLSAVLTGVAALAPKASKLASVLRKGADVTNPIKLATTAAKKTLNPTARALMQSSIKPTIAQLKKGDAKVAVDTLLKYGLSPNEKGVEQLRDVIDDINQKISGRVSASNATVDRGTVLNALDDVRQKFGTQVNPSSDLGAIQQVGDEFKANWPAQLPVKLAQNLKQGTYKTLSGKYGEVGSASTEAQKALARGLKENIAQVVPGIGALNAEESRLLKTLGVTERRALMDLNKNPLGLAALAGNPTGFAAFMADRSAAFKALVARMANRTAGAAGFAGQNLATPALVSGVAGNAVQNDQR